MRWTCLIAIALLIGFVSGAAAQTPASAGRPAVDTSGDPLPPGAIMRLGSGRWRPGGSVTHLAFSPDGQRLATYHQEHYSTAAVTLWDVATGRELRRVEIPGIDV